MGWYSSVLGVIIIIVCMYVCSMYIPSWSKSNYMSNFVRVAFSELMSQLSSLPYGLGRKTKTGPHYRYFPNNPFSVKSWEIFTFILCTYYYIYVSSLTMLIMDRNYCSGESNPDFDIQSKWSRLIQKYGFEFEINLLLLREYQWIQAMLSCFWHTFLKQ